MANATPIEPDKELEALLEEIDLQHVVLEFAFYQSESPQNYDSHFDAAYEFLDASHKRFQQHYATIDFAQYPLAKNHVFKWNPDELVGSRISFAEFWGSDDVAQCPSVTALGRFQTLTGSKRRSFCRHMDCRSQKTAT